MIQEAKDKIQKVEMLGLKGEQKPNAKVEIFSRCGQWRSGIV